MEVKTQTAFRFSDLSSPFSSFADYRTGDDPAPAQSSARNSPSSFESSDCNLPLAFSLNSSLISNSVIYNWFLPAFRNGWIPYFCLKYSGGHEFEKRLFPNKT